MLPPFWVIGAPRSGTTFLAKVLDHHPKVFLTNETRVMLLFSRMLNRSAEHRRLLATSHDEIVDSLWRHLPGLIEQVYRDLGATSAQRWGDKYPQYADKDLDPEALTTIDRLFPESQYVHIIRDPRAVVASILAKGWLEFDAAIATWRSFVTHAREFGEVVGPDRYHEFRFEDLVADGPSEAAKVFTFLGLPPSDAVNKYLRAEERSRTRISYPTGRPGSTGSAAWEGRLDEGQVHMVDAEMADMMGELGYEPTVANS